MYKVKFNGDISDVVHWLLKHLKADPILPGASNRSGYRTAKHQESEIVFSIMKDEVWFKHETDTVLFTLVWGCPE